MKYSLKYYTQYFIFSITFNMFIKQSPNSLSFINLCEMFAVLFNYLRSVEDFYIFKNS